MDTKSTDSYFIELAGRHGRAMPLIARARKQGGTSQNTAELEPVSSFIAWTRWGLMDQKLRNYETFCQYIMKSWCFVNLCLNNYASEKR